MIIPVILSGGSGSRLWPVSRTLFPKQFLSLIDTKTLFQNTVLRLPKNAAAPVIVCNEEHRFVVAEQLRQINYENNGVILEPSAKNTAPAVALAALNAIQNNDDPVLLVLSADHIIQNVEKFHDAINSAKIFADDGKISLLGVRPTKAETGFGYIEVKNLSSSNSYDIKSFKEKPSLNMARKYLASDKYFWNSGIFLFKASVYLNELQKYEPEIYSACLKSCNSIKKDSDFIRIDNSYFDQCPSKSIDYAVLEKTNLGVVVPLDVNWSDIGSWSGLWDVKTKDKNENVVEGDVKLHNVNNSYIYSTNRLISAIDISDLVIIDTQDALLVSSKKSESIKEFVNQLRQENRSEANSHRKVFRPWGYFDSVDYGENFQVKHIFVNPKSKLSLQKHQFRAEHWVVIKGKAKITCGEKIFELNENQSTYISKGEIHRLENETNTSLEIIEIQTGSYIGEDDIIRIEDDYKRS
tara:strand:- start:147 stop:1547 length:1401 start_codon:yes stop_codon:yes gene_type:complete